MLINDTGIMLNEITKVGLFSRLFYDRASAVMSALGGLIFCFVIWDYFPFLIFIPFHFFWLYLSAYKYFLCKSLESELRQNPIAIEGWDRYKLLKLGRLLAWRSNDTMRGHDDIPTAVGELIQDSMLVPITRLNNIVIALIILLWVGYMGLLFL